MLDFSVEIAGIRLEHPLMNGAGTCKLIDGDMGVKTLVRSATSAIVVGSITLEPRPGNSGDVFFVNNGFSLNSMGLPNPGADYYRKNLPEMVKLAHQARKPLFVSVAGFTHEEYADLTVLAFDGGADLVELNLACPNVWQGSSQKRIACFDSKLVSEILRTVEEKV